MQLGTLARGVVASSDATGAVEGAGWRLSWRLLVGEQWTAPGAGAPLRRSRPYAAPVEHLAMRIAGGDAVARAYAVDRPDAVVVEIENDSPAAIGAALLLRASGAYALSSRRPPRASETDGAVVFPIAHRTTLRVAVAAGAVDVRALPGVDAVVRGWDRLLDRGMRVEVPDPLQGDVDRARADLLLAPPSAVTFAALEAWGFDDEAVACWERLGMRARHAARRTRRTDLLTETRAALVREAGRTVELFPGFRLEWLGQPVAVHDAPLRRGRCSFALRWHGARPALLWDAPPGSTVRVPALDATFSSGARAGETLLAEPPTTLLAMGPRAPVGGASVDAPEQFT